MFDKVLIANRGEIAVRVVRACRELGVRTVAVYSTAERDSMAVRLADESVCIGAPPGRHSYRNAAAMIEAALQTGADAVHPGYGFLSEDPDFAEICEDNGLTFIGPQPDVIAVMSDKATARKLMKRAGLPLLPGCIEAVGDLAEAHATAADVGYPVILKAVAGGGGRGISVVWSSRDLPRAYRETRGVAQSNFSDDRVYVEQYLQRARHVEVQFICDRQGNGVHFGTRDCSVQRRHQKLMEEAPAPGLPAALLDEISTGAVRAVLTVRYSGIGTAEFLVDEKDRYYFMEINSRIQVEHPVTEMITGVDLVHEQLYVASGQALRHTQEDVDPRGVSVQARVNAEDPDRKFAPTPGVLERFTPPGGPFTRLDTHCYPGLVIGPNYDSLLAKVVVWAPERDEALDRMERALFEFDVAGSGLRTTIPFLRRVLADPEFRRAGHTTGLVDRLTAAHGPPNRRTHRDDVRPTSGGDKTMTTDSPASPTRVSALDVEEILIRNTGVEPEALAGHAHVPLADLQVDSLAALELHAVAKSRWGVTLPDDLRALSVTEIVAALNEPAV